MRHDAFCSCCAVRRRLAIDAHPMLQGGGISCGGTSHGRGTPSGATSSTQAATLQRLPPRAPPPPRDDRRKGCKGEPRAWAAPRNQCRASQQTRMIQGQVVARLLCLRIPQMQHQQLSLMAAVTLATLTWHQTGMQQGVSGWHCGLLSCASATRSQGSSYGSCCRIRLSWQGRAQSSCLLLVAPHDTVHVVELLPSCLIRRYCMDKLLPTRAHCTTLLMQPPLQPQPKHHALCASTYDPCQPPDIRV